MTKAKSALNIRERGHGRPNCAAPDEEDCSLPALAARAASAPDEVPIIANLYHDVRLTARHVAAKADQIQFEARALFPDPPAEISDPAKSGYSATLLPTPDWPQWRREIFDRWVRQCSLIEQALGVDVADEASRTAWRLMDQLAERAFAIPAKSIKDVLDKIGIVNWEIDDDLLAGEVAGKRLRVIEADLKRLDERDAA